MPLILFSMMIGVLVLSVMWSGYILSILWSWFMVPIFGLPELSVAAAIGVTIVFGYFIRSLSTSVAESKNYAQVASQAFFTPLVFLFMGWIVKSFL